MSQTIILSDRDRFIMDCLGNRVRLLTPSQIARAFFDGDDRYAQRRIRSLVKAGLVSSHVLVSRVSPPLEAPLVSWEPGWNEPEFGALSSTLLGRWMKQPATATRVMTLGARASKLLGRQYRRGVKNPLQVGHDLALSEVFVRYLNLAPELAHGWLVENRLHDFGVVRPQRGQAVPDAMIINQHAQPIRAIELGGLYSPGRLESLHRSLSHRRLGYELW